MSGLLPASSAAAQQQDQLFTKGSWDAVCCWSLANSPIHTANNSSMMVWGFVLRDWSVGRSCVPGGPREQMGACDGPIQIEVPAAAFVPGWPLSQACVCSKASIAC